MLKKKMKMVSFKRVVTGSYKKKEIKKLRKKSFIIKLRLVLLGGTSVLVVVLVVGIESSKNNLCCGIGLGLFQ